MQEFHPDVLQDLYNWQILRNKSPSTPQVLRKFFFVRPKDKKQPKFRRKQQKSWCKAYHGERRSKISSKWTWLSCIGRQLLGQLDGSTWSISLVHWFFIEPFEHLIPREFGLRLDIHICVDASVSFSLPSHPLPRLFSSRIYPSSCCLFANTRHLPFLRSNLFPRFTLWWIVNFMRCFVFVSHTSIDLFRGTYWIVHQYSQNSRDGKSSGVHVYACIYMEYH